MRLSEQAAERLCRESADTLNSLFNEIPLLLEYSPRDEAGKRVGKTRSLALIDRKSATELKKQPNMRPDGLVAGSQEAMDKMSEYLARQGLLGPLDEAGPTEGLDLFSGRLETFDDSSFDDDDFELMKGNLGLFRGV